MTHTYTFDEDLISDLHKDAYGFRPSQSFWSFFAAANADQKQMIWDSLCYTADAAALSERQEREFRENDFQVRVASMMHAGCPDFETAIRWLHDAHDTNGDDDYLEYCLGVGYGYIRQAREAAKAWTQAA